MRKVCLPRGFMEAQWGENSEPRRHTELFSSYGLGCAQDPWNPGSSAATPVLTWGLLVALRGWQRKSRSPKPALKSLTSRPPSPKGSCASHARWQRLSPNEYFSSVSTPLSCLPPSLSSCLLRVPSEVKEGLKAVCDP